MNKSKMKSKNLIHLNEVFADRKVILVNTIDPESCWREYVGKTGTVSIVSSLFVDRLLVGVDFGDDVSGLFYWPSEVILA